MHIQRNLRECVCRLGKAVESLLIKQKALAALFPSHKHNIFSIQNGLLYVLNDASNFAIVHLNCDA